MTDYTELKRLAEAAPEGPWFGPEYDPGTSYVFGVDLGSLLHYEGIDTEQDSCLRYVAAANPAAILALIAENERLLTLLARMVNQHVPLTELEGVPGWDRAVELVEVVAERDSLKLEAENLRTVQRASFNASGQIKAAASELGFNPAQEEGALEFLIGLARELTVLREKCARLEEDNEAMWENPGDLL